jgi:hypothetical protein
MNQIQHVKPHHAPIHKVGKLEQSGSTGAHLNDDHGSKEAVDLNRGDHGFGSQAQTQYLPA